jgi:stage V sporulation protein G
MCSLEEVINMEEQMDVKVVRLRRFENGDSKLKAFVDVAVGEFIVKGLRLLNGEKGLFLAMPQEKGKDGKWYNAFYPTTKEARQNLFEVVLAAYQD